MISWQRIRRALGLANEGQAAPDVFDEMRSRLRGALTPGCHVSEHRGLRSYFFDDDTAAGADVTVSDSTGIRLAVLRVKPEPQLSFALGIWRRFAQEIWVVDFENRRIERIAGEERRLFGPDDAVRSLALPNVELVPAELFSARPRP